MKKKIAILLSLAMLMTMLAVPAMADQTAASVVIDGKTVSFDVAPVNENGHLLVPLRAIFEQMGAKVEWDQATQTATAVKGDTKVVIAIGSLEPTINGQVSKIDVAAKLVDNRTLAPMRFVCEAFGGKVAWDETQKIASVVSAAAPATTPAATPAKTTDPAKTADPAKTTDPAKTADPAKTTDATATPDSVVKAAIAAFAPTTATIDLNGNLDVAGGNKFSAKGTAQLAADKKATSSLDINLGLAGNNKPALAFCPFSEIIAGPEADGLAVVKGAKLSEEGNNYVLTVTGAPCPASLQGILDGASVGAKAQVKFKLTVDYTIKVDKTSKKVVSVDIVKGTGTGNVMGMDVAATATGTITYK